MNYPNRVPCPDCRHSVSTHSESCVNSGHFFQQFAMSVTVDWRGWAWTISRYVLAVALISYVLSMTVYIAGMQRLN